MKVAAAIQGKSIKNYVLECALPTHEEQGAFQKLESLLAKRVKRAQIGELSDKTLDSIFDEQLETR